MIPFGFRRGCQVRRRWLGFGMLRAKNEPFCLRLQPACIGKRIWYNFDSIMTASTIGPRLLGRILATINYEPN